MAACAVSPPPSGGVNTVTCNSLTPGAGENISTLAGNDIVFMQQGLLGTLDLGTGNDTANITGAGTTITTLTMGDATATGVDTTAISNGTVTTLTQGTESHVLTVSGSGIVDSVDQRAGADEVSISGGSIGALVQGSGIDTLTITGGSVTSANQGSESDSFTMSSGSVGILDQGSSADSALVSGGTITNITQGTGNDTLTIQGGSVTGAVSQDAGSDTFIMSAGTIDSLTQGADIDSAFMNGGTITGLFFAGDNFEFAGGSVGEVNLEVADNDMAMWGIAAIVGDLNSENGEDEYDLFGGTIGGTVSTGSADDVVTIGGTQTVFNGVAITPSTGATNVSGDVILEGGSDTLTQNAGQISGSVYLDGGPSHTNALGSDTFNDSAVFAGGTVLGSVFADFASGAQVGNDAVDVTGTAISGGVDLGDGDNTFSMTAGSVGANVESGSGVDEFRVSGGIIAGAINSGAGEDILKLTGGAIGAGATTGQGADSVEIDGSAIMGLVDTGSEADTITLSSGSVSASILAGTGDDGFTWSGGSLGAGFAGGDGSDTATVSTSNYNGAQLLDGGDDVATGDGFTDTLNLNGLTVTANGGNLLNWELLNLNSTALTLDDSAITVGTLNVNNGSTLASSGALSVTGNVATATGGSWLAPAGGSVSGNLSNAGTVDLRDGAVGDVLSVNGNYVGGGVVGLDVDTGANSADMLAIAGDVTGPASSLALDNLSLAGSYTGDGPGAGIALVSVGGTTDAGDFSLSGGPIVAGGFLYNLSLEADGTFYLQSSVSGGAVAASTIGLLIGDVGQTFLGTRHERVGEQERAETSNIWGRALGSFANEDVTASGIGTIRNDTDITGLQAGMDLIAHEARDGSRTRIGVYGGLSWLSADAVTADSGGAASSTSGDGHVAALYASHDNASGWYADAVMQGEWLNLNAAGDAGGTRSTDAAGWLASLEMGTTFQLTETAWLEPQAQVIYGRNGTDAAMDSAGVVNTFSDDEMLVGRLGARLKSSQKLGDGEGGFVTGWLKANIWADVLADDQSVVLTSSAGTTAVDLSRKAMWADLGMGFDIQANSWMTLYADGDVSVGLDGSYQAFAGKTGIRLAF